MAIVGLIPFVYAAIKRKRRSTARARARAVDPYESLNPGGASRGHARGAYQSQTCHFAVLPSPDEELGFLYDDFGGAARRPPSKDKDLPRSRELFQADRYKRATGVAPAWGRENGGLDGGHKSQSCRFAVRPPSPVHELVVSRDDIASRRPSAEPKHLSLQLFLPASRQDGLDPGAARSNSNAYQSESYRFAVHRSAAYVASPPSEDLSGKLLVPAGQRGRGLSRSLRFSSMRVFAWVSGA
ncbi:unnamed protein product [Alopecurus aequalis]